MKAIVLDGDKLVQDGKGFFHPILKEFKGPDAQSEASAFIGTLPDFERGRYWLDVCIPDEDAHCPDCGCPGE